MSHRNPLKVDRMATDLAKKKRVRSGHKGSATRTVRQITELLGTESPDRDRLALLRMTLKEKHCVGIVFDGGSQKLYLTQRVKTTLNLPVDRKKSLSIAAFGSRKGRPRLCEVVHLAIQTKFGDSQLLEVFVVPHICDPVMTQSTAACVRMYGHLSQLDLADFNQDEAMQVDLLIGSDFYWEFVTGRTIRGEDGPVAIEISLGWVLSGQTGLSEQERSAVSLMNTHTLRVEGMTNRELDKTLKTFWELESLGIEEVSNDPVCDRFTSTLQVKNGRYEVSLPWRDYHDDLPDNYDLSWRRLPAY